MFGVTAQICHVLLLVRLIAHGDRPVRHCRLRGPFRVPAMAYRRDHPARHIAFELIAAKATAAAQANARVVDFIIRFVLQIAKPKRAGIEAVFIRRGCGRDNRTVELGVIADGNIKTAVTGKQPGLLGHRIEAAFHFVLASVDIA